VRGKSGKMKQWILWRMVLSLALFGIISQPAWATAATAPNGRPTAPLDLTTSPLPISLSAKPGQTISTTIKVKQSGGDTEELQVHLMKFSADGSDGKPTLSDRGPGDTYFDWVTFDKPEFSAPSDVWQNIKMTIAIPKDAAFEYNYAVEITRVGDDLAPGGEQEAIAGGTAVLVLLNVNSPGATRSLQLESFSVTHSMMEFVPATFNASFYNSGNTYIQPSGDIFITQGNHQIGTVLLNDEQGNILAGTHRIYSTTWSDGFPFYEPLRKKGIPELDRHGNQIMTLNWNLPTNTEAAADTAGASTTNITETTESANPLSRLRFGEYTARLVAVYTDVYGRDVPITSQVTFWVIPWRILLAFLVILLVFGFAAYSMINNVLRRRQRTERLKRKNR
jgi:hypothetical protein